MKELKTDDVMRNNENHSNQKLKKSIMINPSINKKIDKIAGKLLTPPGNYCVREEYDCGVGSQAKYLHEITTVAYSRLSWLLYLANELRKIEHTDPEARDLAWRIQCDFSDLIRVAPDVLSSLKKCHSRMERLNEDLEYVIGEIEEFKEDVDAAFESATEKRAKLSFPHAPFTGTKISAEARK